MDTPVKLIVGLGNPGPKYAGTRHNAGAQWVRALGESLTAKWQPDTKFFGETARVLIDDQDVRLLLPSTYMNRSGQSVAAMANFYQIRVQEILIAHDELDLAPGIARFKKGGGHGGHNGLRDTIQALGNNSGFSRLRIGIGHPGSADQVVDFVLKKPPPADQKLIESSIQAAINALPLAVKGQWERAMTKLHSG